MTRNIKILLFIAIIIIGGLFAVNTHELWSKLGWFLIGCGSGLIIMLVKWRKLE